MADPTLPQPYPLQWPEGKRRTPARDRVKGIYSIATVTKALDDLATELRRCGVTQYELTSLYIGRGGSSPRMDDPGAALWFLAATRDVTAPRQLMTMACDKFLELPQNIRGISLTMQRLRLVDEIGAYSFVQAVEGAKALPAPDRPWWEILHVVEGAPIEVAEASYRALVKGSHPDAGGDPAAFGRLQRAIEQARARKLG